MVSVVPDAGRPFGDIHSDRALHADVLEKIIVNDIMSKDKKSTIGKEKNPKVKEPSKPSRLMTFMRGEQGKFTAGLLILTLSAMLGVGFLSFVVTGKHDQAVLENLPWYKMLLPHNGVSNWMGSFGAFTAEYCMNRWLGLPVLLFIGLMLRYGYSLLIKGERPKLLMPFVRTSLSVLWLSLFLSAMCYIIDELFDAGMLSNYLYLGGKHGNDLTQLILANLHVPGLVLLLIASGLLLSSLMFKGTIEKTRTLWGLIPCLQRRVDAWKARREAKRLEREQQDQGEPEEPKPAEGDATDGTLSPADTDTLTGETAQGTVSPVTDSEDDETPSLGLGNTGEEPAVTDDPVATVIAATQAPVQPLVAPVTVVEKVVTVTRESEPTAEKAIEPVAEKDPQFTVTTGKTETVQKPIAADTSDLPQGEYDPTAELSTYKFPPFELLREAKNNASVDMEEQTSNKEKIRQTLSDYGIEIKSISATVGPTITLFEIVLESGTKISRVRNLSDEIAMSIASKAGVRIIAPIPGKSAIGIEVPNNDPKTVSMRECIASKTFQESKMDLPVALGKTITNEVFTFDLAKAPHLLVAGATGQGKSVGLNAIITSLLYKKHPSQLKIVLVDPKMVEFSIYKRLERHYLAKLPDMDNPIITDVTKTVDILKSLCAEMEDRYALVEDAGVRNIKEYNDKFVHRHLNPKKHITAPIGSREGTHHRYLPYIVAVIDEYGDLIMTAGKEVELPIARIAQKARAVGIHMIIATQRPSAKIVTGIIKANFPARIAFRVAAAIDSSIILDQTGAQSLIGRGDLLMSTGNAPTRVQCAFVDTPEVDSINHFIAEQPGYATALILPEPKLQEGEGGDATGGGDAVDLDHLDPLFEECAELVVATGQGSTSMIQRKFGIGYNRAGRIMDQLEKAGVVGAYSGSKARSVLVASDSELRMVIDNIKNS